MSTNSPKKSFRFALVSGIALLGMAVLFNWLASDWQGGTPTTTPSLSSDEPVSVAADAILPSVVHIQTSDGVGSGIVYREDGMLITAAHVVGDDEKVLVRLADGTQMEGTVVGTAAEVDVAVVSVDRNGLKPAVFSTARPRVGQMAIAVGSPWGLASTVTAGIISAVDQTNCNAGSCISMVQTDAAINPGNSGGALINRLGEVVGINVSIYSVTGSNDGVGFAVPAPTVVLYADAIIAGEPLETAYLGVRISPATGSRAGANILEVMPDTAASDAGLREGDVIVRVAGVAILSDQDLQAQIRTHRPGSPVELTIFRDGREVTRTVVLGVRTEDT